MPYVQVPKDLTKVNTKVAFNLTKRQIICFGSGGAVGVPVYFLTKSIVGNDIAMLLLIATAVPFFLFGMYERDGQPLEKVLRNFIQWRKAPKVRIYRTNNIYTMYKRDKEARDIVKNNSKNGGDRKIRSRKETGGKATRKTAGKTHR